MDRLREIRDRISRETKDMNFEELQHYFEERKKKFDGKKKKYKHRRTQPSLAAEARAKYSRSH